MNLGGFSWSEWAITLETLDAPPLPELVLINHVIKSIEDDLITGWEGILSVPGLRGEVQHWRYIHLIWQD